jgi:hypothetical protein
VKLRKVVSCSQGGIVGVGQNIAPKAIRSAVPSSINPEALRAGWPWMSAVALDLSEPAVHGYFGARDETALRTGQK